MTNTQSPAPGVAAILSKLQEQEPIGYSGVERTDVDVGVTRDAVLRWVHADEEDEPLYSLAQIRTALQASAAAVEKPPQITLDFKQATELLDMFGGEPSTVTLIPGDGHSGKGLYAYWSELPEEGAMYLGETDDEAAPPLPAQVQEAEANFKESVGLMLAAVGYTEEYARQWPKEKVSVTFKRWFDEQIEAARTPAPGMAGVVRHGPYNTNPLRIPLYPVESIPAEPNAPHPAPAPQAAGAVSPSQLLPLPKPKRFFGHSTMMPMWCTEEMQEYAAAHLAANSLVTSAAFDDGWRLCAKLARRDDLLADMDSAAFKDARAIYIAIASTATGRAGS